jgi:hypothetical protein
MLQALGIAVLATIVATLLVTAARYCWVHRHRLLFALRGRLQRAFETPKKRQARLEREAQEARDRRDQEMLLSDDPNVWKRLDDR